MGRRTGGRGSAGRTCRRLRDPHGRPADVAPARGQALPGRGRAGVRLDRVATVCSGDGPRMFAEA
eukprot:2648743-Alexandrium_andersonii.AAC.1